MSHHLCCTFSYTDKFSWLPLGQISIVKISFMVASCGRPKQQNSSCGRPKQQNSSLRLPRTATAAGPVNSEAAILSILFKSSCHYNMTAILRPLWLFQTLTFELQPFTVITPFHDPIICYPGSNKWEDGTWPVSTSDWKEVKLAWHTSA